MKNILLFKRNSRLCCILILQLVFLPAFAFQQQQPITGTVTDASGALPGVSITIKGTTHGTLTDENGYYSINARQGDVLVFSYIGYKTVEVSVTDQLIIDVVLEQDATVLDGVVINAGYYSVKDRERTGSIARITSKDIEKQPVNNPLEALQGRMTGVHIVQNSGVPGGGLQVYVRGQNSIAAGNEPLYVIDGVPYDSGTLGYAGLSGTMMPNGNISPLNTLDSSVIESIEVLKDADATAIYGSRGANGVVLVTTKKGKTGKTSFKINTYSGVVTATRTMKLMNTEQYLEMRREAFANDGITQYPANAYDVNGIWDENRYTDWQKEFIGNPAYNNAVQATVSGGSDLTRFSLGGTFQKETTVFPMDFNYKRTTAFANINHRSKDNRFAVQFTTNFGADKNLQPGTDLSRTVRTLQPNAPTLYDENGNLNWENSTWTNPLAALESKYKNKTNNMLANAVLSYNIIKGLEIKTNLGYTYSQLEEIKTNPHTMHNPAFGLTSAISNIHRNNSSRNSWIIEPQLDARYEFWDGMLQAAAGSTFQEQKGEQLAVLASGFTNNNLITNLSAANNVFVLGEAYNQYRYHAIYGRINYNWKQKYILNLTGRRDGSSRFGPDNRYANFGAIGAAWLFAEESAIQKSLSVLSFGKLRVSYGTTGNDQIGDYQYLDTYGIADGNYNGSIGLLPSRLFNPNFAWEKNRKIELALEAGLWRNRLSFTAGYFNNRSDNQLMGIPLPGTTGFSSIQANLDAMVENSGWEIDIQSINVQHNNFKWLSSFNITLPQNKLLAFKDLENSTYANQFVIGKPVTILKLFKLIGVDPETGIYTFEDYNGDGKISSPEDRQHIEDLAPKFYGGLSNSFTYKNWHLDVFLQFVKQKAPNYFFNSPPVGTMFNQPAEVLDRWQQPGDNAAFQTYTAGMNPQAVIAHSQFGMSNVSVSDASFLRLKNVSISYSLPKSWTQKASCRLYVQAQNLLTFTNFKGGDPEQRSGFLPLMKRVTLGVNIEF